jgi:hypothetical protein
MSSLAERYYLSWQSRQAANELERFLSQCPNMSAMQLVEVLLVDQALQWQDAAGPSVEQYLHRFPAIADQPSLVLELVYGEFRAARGLGLTVDADAYVGRFPDLAEPLRRQMEVADWLADEGQDGPPVNQPPSSSDSR